SFQANDYAKALTTSEEWAKGVEKTEAKGDGQDRTARSLGYVAWYALFAKQPQKALDAAERALELEPDILWIKINRAHALLFLGRTSAAIKAYVEHKGETVPNQGKWEEVILKDFTEFRTRGLDSPKLSAMEQALAAATQSPAAELYALNNRIAVLYQQG